MECKECGTLLESEPFYKFSFRVKDIPRILVEEAHERYDTKLRAGDYKGYYGSKGRLIRIELEKVVLSRLRFWYEQDEVEDRTAELNKKADVCEDVCEATYQVDGQVETNGTQD